MNITTTSGEFPEGGGLTSTAVTSFLSFPDQMSSSVRTFRLVVNVHVVGLLCVFGMAGNLVSLVVLSRDRSIRRTTGLLLRALALTDTAYLIIISHFPTA